MAGECTHIGRGVTLKFAATSTVASSLRTLVGDLIDIDTGEASGDDIEETALESTTRWREYCAADVDPGEVRITTNYAETTARKQIGTLLKTGVKKYWYIIHPSTAISDRGFTAYVKSMGQGTWSRNDRNTGSFTLKISGSPGILTT